MEYVIAHDTDAKGANWARNLGAGLARGELLLFCDDDIRWESGAIAALVEALERTPDASYSFGSYEMGGQVQCERDFSPALLLRQNIASTMSLIRRDHFIGFDESIGRLQDWDLWLSMLKLGRRGIHCGKLIFRTDVRDGITLNGPVDWRTARAAIQQKHNL